MFPVPARAINKSGRLEGCAAGPGAAGLRFPPGRSPRREWGRGRCARAPPQPARPPAGGLGPGAGQRAGDARGGRATAKPAALLRSRRPRTKGDFLMSGLEEVF